MVEHIHRRHNKSLLVYHVVCPVKYRRNKASRTTNSYTAKRSPCSTISARPIIPRCSAPGLLILY